MSDLTGSDVRVVLFDLDDTLFAHRAASKSGFTQALTSFGGAMAAADPHEEYARWRELEEEHYPRYLSGELDLTAQRRVRTRAFAESYGIDLRTDADADRWFAAYFRHYEGSWVVHDDVLPCLDALAPRHIGLITNGRLDIQHRKLVAIGLEGRMEHIVASEEFGVAKPDPAIFLHTCRLFDVPPSSASYVGDRLHTDAMGAASAGLFGVWLDREATATADELVEASRAGVSVIRGLAELPPLLAH